MDFFCYLSFISLVLSPETCFTFGTRVLGIARSCINSASLSCPAVRGEHLKDNQGLESLLN